MPAKKIYQVVNKTRWGKFGAALMNGWFNPDDGEVWRTRPFVPPVTFPVHSPHPVVTEAFRDALVAVDLECELEFSPVPYGKVTKVAWEQWDPRKPVKIRPEDDDPEGYFFEMRESKRTASSMPQLFHVWSKDAPRMTWHKDFWRRKEVVGPTTFSRRGYASRPTQTRHISSSWLAVPRN